MKGFTLLVPRRGIIYIEVCTEGSSHQDGPLKGDHTLKGPRLEGNALFEITFKGVRLQDGYSYKEAHLCYWCSPGLLSHLELRWSCLLVSLYPTKTARIGLAVLGTTRTLPSAYCWLQHYTARHCTFYATQASRQSTFNSLYTQLRRSPCLR